MIKRVFVVVLVILLLSTIVFAASRKAVKIGDTIYAGNLGTATDGVSINGENGIDNTDTIEFLVNSVGYKLKVDSNLPESVRFTLLGTEQTVTVNIHQESSFVLNDGSTVFIRYLEYGRLASDIKIRLGNVGSGAVQTEDGSDEGAADGEEVIAEEEETAAEPVNESDVDTETVPDEGSTNKFSFSRKNIFIGAGVLALIIIIVLAAFFMKKRGGSKKVSKKEIKTSNSDKNPDTAAKENKKEDSFFDPIKD